MTFSILNILGYPNNLLFFPLKPNYLCSIIIISPIEEYMAEGDTDVNQQMITGFF